MVGSMDNAALLWVASMEHDLVDEMVCVAVVEWVVKKVGGSIDGKGCY